MSLGSTKLLHRVNKNNSHSPLVPHASPILVERIGAICKVP